MKPRLVVVLAALWLSCTSLRCNLFEPATPEPPSGSAITPDYTEPDNVLETIAKAVEDKAQRNGQTVYIRAFGDTTLDGRGFHAFFDPASVVRSGRTVPDDWDTAREGNFYAKFVALPLVSTAAYEMSWDPDPDAQNDVIDEAAGTALLHRMYQVTALLETEEIVIAYGFADLYLVRVTSDRWVIVRWDDREGPDPMPNPEAITLGQRRLELQ